MYGLRARNGIRSRPGTPPDENTAMVLSISRIGNAGTDVMGADYFADDTEDDREVMRKDQRKTMELTEQKSGIGWKFAGQGLSLLSLSISESNALSQKPESSAALPSFSRQLYIHALTYLLRGLPTDLTTEEGLSVRSALPPGIAAPIRLEIDGVEMSSYRGSKNRLGRSTNKSQPSFLHRTLATSIINFFILVQFLLPYIKVLLRAAYEYERTHHISEKVLASSIETVDGLGRMGMRGGGVIWGSGLALGVGEAVNWIVEGVSGGIQEGLGEGMARVGVRKEVEAKQDNDL